MSPTSDPTDNLPLTPPQPSGLKLVPPDAIAVLMISDTPEDRRAARLALEPGNFTFTEAPNGRCGIALVERSTPDCILLDYHLPDMNGPEVIASLRRTDGTLPCATIMLTARGNAMAAAAALKAGVQDFIITDRLDEDSLQRAIRNAVTQFRLLRDKAAAERRNAQLAAIVASSNDAIFSVGPDRVILSWNPGAERLFGYTEDEARGRSVEELFVPESHVAERETIHRTVMLEGKSITLETVRRHKRGHLIPVEISASPILDARGAVCATSVILRDITERKRIEMDLRDTKEQLDLALHASSTGVWDYDLTTDRVTWSADIYTIFEVDEFAGTGEAFTELVHPDDREAVWQAVHKALTNRVRFECEFRIVRPSGEVRWVSNVGRGIYDQGGEAVRLLGIVTDITERKQTERALLDSEHRLAERVTELQTLLDVSPIGIALSRDSECRDVWVNPALRDLLRLKENTHAGASLGGASSYRVLKNGCEVSADEKPMHQACAQGRPVLDQELEIVFADGSRRFILMSAVPLFDIGGKVRGGIAFGIDITERKRAEEHISLLMEELNHRSKNLLSVVQAVARQTAAQSQRQDFITDLTARLQAMSTSQELLMRGNWRGIRVTDLVRSQLGHLGAALESRVQLDGDGTILNPTAAQGIGLALHELGTNAIKYGALSNDNGHVAIHWSMLDDRESRFRISWTESGGPPVTPPARRGFGRTVIERMAAHAVSGKVELRYAPEGVTWRLDAPSHSVILAPAADSQTPRPPK